jgi:CheY-like chemotaxis protein
VRRGGAPPLRLTPLGAADLQAAAGPVVMRGQDSPAGRGKPTPTLRRFQDLMPHRVRNILLVASLYDSFILTEDGHLNEAILRQYADLDLRNNPDLRRVSTGAEVLELARDPRRCDMIVTSMQVADMDAVELAQRVRAENLGVPVLLLAYNNRELTDFMARKGIEALDRVFLWQGDVRIVLAMVKYVEDRQNVEHDTGELKVPLILVIEDNVRFYSSFLPTIYTELMDHTRTLIQEGLNLSQMMTRTRARPKVLLCTTYEEAWEYFSRYNDEVLGVISDIEFPRGGELDRRAGLELTSRIRKVREDIPIVLQSSFPQNEELATSMDAAFLLKGSPVLLHQLRRVLTEHFGFGDFVFRSPDGAVIDRANDLATLIEKLRTVPAESICYHGERNHFSNWLKARTEFALAETLRPRKVSDFESPEHLRNDLIRAINEYRRERDKAVVADFDRHRRDAFVRISRIGGGSLGGKARGLAFANRLLKESDLQDRYPQVRIGVPQSVVLGTDIFDQFMDQDGMGGFALGAAADEETERRLLEAPFPEEIRQDLAAFLATCSKPLAVRSSGLLEDSPSQPFAGVYRTYMLPNNDPDPMRRLAQLVAAVKRVYASTFSQQAKAFLQMTPFRLEEEKMAVIIQEIVGAVHGQRFYPDFSGVARSYNFYPTPPLRGEDGVVAVALGLGKAVVDGASVLRFCPEHPQHIVTFSSAEEVLRNSQREFYALPLDRQPTAYGEEGIELSSHGLEVAERDGVLAALGSTYSHDNDVVYDGTSRPGVRLVSFAPILKHGVFPLAEILHRLLELGSEGTSSDVEIEFAVNLSVPKDCPSEFGFLQMRPMALSRERDELEIGHVLSSQVVCRSSNVLGNGSLTELRDLVVVDFHRFQRSRSRDVARDVARLNGKLLRESVPYVLIGVGRWGSTDPYLGIPVSWSQVAGARVIVEAGFKDFKVAPSQGTHFFQNLTSCNVGYFTVNPGYGEGFVDWEWLAARPAVEESEFVRHIRLDAPLIVKMSGRRGEGVILKPHSDDAEEGA